MSEAEKPLRPRKVYDAKFTVLEPRSSFKGILDGAIHRKYFPDDRIALASQILEKWAMVAAEPDGEDSAGRSKLRVLTPFELTERACDIADHAFTQFERRGWLVALPSIDEQEEAGRYNAERN
jgi:hypothetical protein